MKKIIIILKHVFEFTISLQLIIRLRNWASFLFYYLGIKGNDFLVITRKNLKLQLRKHANDHLVIHEIILRDDYRINKFRYEKATIIDIGANIGVFSLFCSSKWPDTKIYSYEPDTDNFKFLRKNIDINGANNISPFQYFVSNKSTENENSTDTISLNDIFDKNKIQKCHLLKMDIEGAEYKTLYHTPHHIFDKIDRIHLEFHDLNQPDCTGKKLNLFLKQRGFKTKYVPALLTNHGYIFCRR